MKNKPLRLVIYFAFIIFVSVQSCTCSKDKFEPIRADESQEDNSKEIRYVLDEILVIYKDTPTPERQQRIKDAVVAAGIDINSLTIKRCNSCGDYIELWHAAGIHSVIHTDAIKGGTVGRDSKGVGEDSLAQYSLNYKQHLPVEQLPSRKEYRIRQMPDNVNGIGKDTIIIAVLDTGIDTTAIVPGQHVWKNKVEKNHPSSDDDSNCYPDDVAGWNFIDNNADITDNNTSLHGTIVSHYIVNEFKTSPTNYVQIMSLKTHDANGSGDLFSSICALHYAMDKGAHIVNASWGFYFYHDGTHPYLDSLVTKGLKEKGMLFITAAGNKIEEIDNYARAAYQEAHGVVMPDSLLRNLNYHNFYPAFLSESDNNVIVATTTDGEIISPTQNYASRYVDVGVKADTVNASSMKFLLPFSATPLYISGSSFATAIVAGKVGAHISESAFTPGISKQPILENLATGASPVLIRADKLESQDRIRDGRYTQRE